MARIRERKRSDGGSTFHVSWVIGGGRTSAGASEQSESFTSRNRAEAFKLDVEHAGNQWPAGWAKGKGYVTVEAEPVGTTFGPDYRPESCGVSCSRVWR